MAKTKKTEVKEETKRAAIYCRVSTEEQGSKDDNSLEVQEATLRIYCASQGLQVIDEYIYVDRGISGKSLNRPEIQRLRADAGKGRFQCVVATKLDRLSRSVKDFLDLDYELQKLNIDIKIQSQNFDTTTPSGRMLRMMLMAFAEFERDMISERTSEATKYLAQQGHPRSGEQLGYNRVNKLWIVNEQESELVNKIFNLYIKNPSTPTVARLLNEQGFRTKLHTTKKGKVIGGTAFTKNNINQILTNQEYLGKVKYKNQLYEGKHEAIVPEETFNLVQEQLKRSQKTQRHVTKERIIPMPLGDILYCGFCGNRLTPGYGTKDGKRHYYYKCTNKVHNTSTACPGKTLNANRLEHFINTIFEVLATDERTFELNYRNITKSSSSQQTELEKENGLLLINFAREKGRLGQLVNTLSIKDKTKSPKSVLDEIERTELTVKSLNEKIKSNELKISRLKTGNYDIDILKKAFLNYVTAVKSLPADKRKIVYQSFFERITSFVDAKTGAGDIVIKVHADGEIVRNWAILKTFELSEFESSSLRLDVYPREDSNLRPIV